MHGKAENRHFQITQQKSLFHFEFRLVGPDYSDYLIEEWREVLEVDNIRIFRYDFVCEGGFAIMF